MIILVLLIFMVFFVIFYVLNNYKLDCVKAEDFCKNKSGIYYNLSNLTFNYEVEFLVCSNTKKPIINYKNAQTI